jgi:RNA polymerase-interacting CarD/CdnL/TRCF family regulator
MNLARFRANVDFSQWSLSIPGIPVERSDKTGTAKLFEQYLLEQILQVLQPPEYERTLAL